MTAEVASLPAAAAAAGDGCAVILSLGARGARAPSLLNAALGTALPCAPRAGAGPAPAALVAAPAAPPNAALVLSVDALDSRVRAAAAAADASLVVALGVAGAVVLAVRLADVARPAASGVDALFGALERNLRMRAAGAARIVPQRRLFVVAVRDYEQEEVSERELCDCIREQLAAHFGRAAKPAGVVDARLDDLFEVCILLFPNETAAPDKHADVVGELRALFAPAAVREFTDPSLTAAVLVQSVSAVATAIDGDKDRSLPADRELTASFSCDAIMQKALATFLLSLRQWRSAVEDGRIVANYGSETTSSITKTLAVFEADCAVYAGTRAFARKKEELKSKMLSESYTLYARQISKLRELGYQVFRAKLGRIRINSQVEKSVKGVVREAEQYFIEKAEHLVCRLGNWRFDNERQQLVKRMREDATERLQMARLQGNYVPPFRAPLAFALHTLLSAPFGQDSRTGHPHAEEMQQKFDPDKVKKAGLLRNRPYPTRYSIKLDSSRAMPPGAMDILDDIFDDGK